MSADKKTTGSFADATSPHASETLRPATHEEYADYLIARLQAGGKITDLCSCESTNAWEPDHITRPKKVEALGEDLARFKIFTAQRDGTLADLGGTNSVQVIVPESINFTTGGHNEVFTMDTPADGSAPLYLDTVRLMKEKGFEVEREHMSADVTDNNWQEFCDTYVGNPWTYEQQARARQEDDLFAGREEDMDALRRARMKEEFEP